MGKLFGTNGVRGVFSEDFTLEFVHDLVLAISTYFKEGRILVGYDGRDSSVVVSKLVCSTLNYAGLDCHLAGLIPTPCLEFATKTLGYNGGIMITASHNPPEYNGIKPVASDGVEVSREDENVIEEIFFKKNWKQNSSTWGSTKNDDRAVQTYLDGIKSQVDVSKIKSKNLKVVLDLGNGAQSVTAIKLCEQLGCEIITINREIDGSFSGRGPEPTPYNLQELSSAVVKNNADLGIAFDGDGDRLVLVDRHGKILDGDDLLYTLISTNGSDPDKKSYQGIVGTLMTNKSLELFLEREGIEFLRTDVGDKYVLRALRERSWILGGEPSGHIICLDHTTTGDALIASVKVLKSLKSFNFDISKALENFTKLPQELISFEVNNPHKIIMNSEVRSEVSKLEKKLGNKGRVLIRPSGTEDLLRVMVEASTKELAEDLAKELSDFIRSRAA